MNRGPRKNIRLSGYDYSRVGAYFVTICTTERAPMFWRDFLCPELSPSGVIAAEEIRALEDRFSSVRIEKCMIMPDHVHMLLTLKRQGQSPCPTLGSVVGAYKSISTKRINRETGALGEKIWQPRYYEHVIRGEEDFLATWRYIEENPARWIERYRV
jgi:REP element-mobilizing transposase RayT